MSKTIYRPGEPLELKWLRQLASMVPDDPDVLLDFAAKLLEHGRHEDAEQQIRAAIALAPNNLDARKLLDRALADRSQGSA